MARPLCGLVCNAWSRPLPPLRPQRPAWHARLPRWFSRPGQARPFRPLPRPRPKRARGRLGEAAVPGPLRLLSVNTTSLGCDAEVGGRILAGWETLLDLEWDLAVLQEARIAPGVLANLCRARGWQCATSIADDAGKALCATIAKVGHLTAAFSCERAQDCLWTTAGHTVRVANLYGPSGGTDRELLETGLLTREALVRAEAGGAGPALIAGDFNALPQDLPCAFSLATAGWRDLHSAGTCSGNSAALPRRIDLLFANPGFRGLVRSTEVSWEAGFPTHAAQVITLDAARPGVAPMWCPAPALPAPVEEGTLAAAFAAIPPSTREAVTTLLSGDDVELAWTGLTGLVEAMYALAGTPVSALCHRQGQAKLQRPTAALTPDGDTANTLLRFHLRRWRRLREVVRLWPDYPAVTTGPASNVWRAIRNSEPRGSCSLAPLPWCSRAPTCFRVAPWPRPFTSKPP